MAKDSQIHDLSTKDGYSALKAQVSNASPSATVTVQRTGSSTVTVNSTTKK